MLSTTLYMTTDFLFYFKVLENLFLNTGKFDFFILKSETI